jgi:hypothetical protein
MYTVKRAKRRRKGERKFECRNAVFLKFKAMTALIEFESIDAVCFCFLRVLRNSWRKMEATRWYPYQVCHFVKRNVNWGQVISNKPSRAKNLHSFFSRKEKQNDCF